MATKIGQYQIPFDEKGDQQGYPRPMWHNGSCVEPTWVDNFEFVDTLTYDDYSTGRSSIGFCMKRLNGTSVNVFVSDFSKMIPHLVRGQITARFTFVKKGANYGCRFLESVSPNNIE